MEQRKVWLVDEASFDLHQAKTPHPECPERLIAARNGLFAGVPKEARVRLQAAVPDLEIVQQVHRASYLQSLEDVWGEWGHLDPDTYVCPQSRDAVWQAAGGAAHLGRVLAEGAERAVALVRPPGHHARPTTAMGFCVLNNIAIAAVQALAAGAERVAIVDWDVHHGNGTQEMFWHDPRVLFVSLHQYPHYPGSGAPGEIGEGAGQYATINVGLPAASGPEAYAEAFRRVVLPALHTFDPTLVLVSAGFDAHARDPLASQELDAASYGAFTSALAARHERIGIVLEGGYDLQALEASLRLVGKALLGTEHELVGGALRSVERDAIEATIRAHESQAWTRSPER